MKHRLHLVLLMIILACSLAVQIYATCKDT